MSIRLSCRRNSVEIRIPRKCSKISQGVKNRVIKFRWVLLLYDFSQEVIASGSERVNRRGSPAGVAWERSGQALTFGRGTIFSASVVSVVSVVFHPALFLSPHARLCLNSAVVAVGV